MKRGLTNFFQIVTVALGIGVLALMLWEPHLEGRNAHATLFEIYFKDPFLAYAYAASIAFFVALYKTLKLLGHIGRNEAASRSSVSALRSIKYCFLTLVAFIVGAEGYLFIVQRGKDDIAGGVAIGVLMILVSVVAATAAAVFEKRLQSAVDTKSESR